MTRIKALLTIPALWLLTLGAYPFMDGETWRREWRASRFIQGWLWDFVVYAEGA